MLDPLTVLRRGPGLVLLSGPTGSGKNSAAMAIIQSLDLSKMSAATIEIAPRIALAGVQQSVVPDLDAQLPMLQQHLAMDTDLVYVRELHSPALAQLVCHAATGRRIISTIHTSDSTSALERLESLGVPPDEILALAPTIQAQRRLPRLCRSCRTPTSINGRALGREGPAIVFEAPGCERCKGTGRRGWRLAAERITPGLSDDGRALRRRFREGRRGAALREAVVAAGLVTLRQSAVRLALGGEVDATDAIVGTPPG